MKLVKHGEPGCGKIEIEGDAKFVQFMFAEFKPLAKGHYAELYDDAGKLIGTTAVTAEANSRRQR